MTHNVQTYASLISKRGQAARHETSIEASFWRPENDASVTAQTLPKYVLAKRQKNDIEFEIIKIWATMNSDEKKAATALKADAEVTRHKEGSS